MPRPALLGLPPRVLLLLALGSCLTFSTLASFSAAPARADENQDRIMQLKRQIVEIQNDGDLAISNMQLCSAVTGYGGCTPLPENILPEDNTLLVYFEPLNWFTAQEDGNFTYALTQDIVIKVGNETIHTQQDAERRAAKTKQPLLDFFITNSINLQSFPEGNYTYEVVLKDPKKQQEALASVEFAVPKREDEEATTE